jgi:UDP-N-acetylglucosamine--N-acetylmuramyl-(pentapeptide) pyrophosphoryl-undecaprenol N-acetylglucosamine transferase
VESSVLERWKGAVFATGARPLKVKHAFALLASIVRCRRAMRRARPDVLLAMGSYSSLPPVLAARSCGVPIVLHEANTVPGKAVEALSRAAVAVATSFEVTARFLPRACTRLTGLPVRADIACGRRFDFIPPDAFVVFVTGGSQGAHAVNLLMRDALTLFRRELARRTDGRPLYVIHQTGVKDEETIRAAYADAGIPARVHAFERAMPDAFASADIVVARAGASTCFELAVCGRPALLIPLPQSMRDHQHHNAEAFAARGAADEGLQPKLTPLQVCRYLLLKYDHPEQLAAMRARMAALATPAAAARVADLVEETGAPRV